MTINMHSVIGQICNLISLSLSAILFIYAELAEHLESPFGKKCEI